MNTIRKILVGHMMTCRLPSVICAKVAVVALALLVELAATAAIPSGTFQFTTDNYSVSSNEGFSPQDLSLRHSLLGARLTVTRSDGFSGRVQVPMLLVQITNYTMTTVTMTTNGTTVSTVDITASILSTNSGTSSGLQTNIFLFDDYQMSSSIMLPPSSYGSFAFSSPAVTNVDPAFTITNIVSTNTFVVRGLRLDPPILDPLESGDLLPPTLGSITNERITVLSASSGAAVSVINFERATFRVDKTEGNAIIHVTRSGGEGDKAVTASYVINAVTHPVQTGNGGNPIPGNTFSLEAGSDYAEANVDFTPVSGTLSWGANDSDDKTITIPILTNGLVQFNRDLQVQLFIPQGNTEPVVIGAVKQATLTILSDSLTPGLQPAGAVDRTWNKDNSDGYDSIPPYLQFPGTKGGVSDTANGNGGTVYAVAVQPDGKSIIAGSFNSYDSNPYNRIVRLLANGYQDPTFMVAPNSGANDTINAVALQADGKIVIGGNFTSFNGVNRYHVARLNADGTLDTDFNPGLGADGPVWAVAVRGDGKIMLGGEFTQYNGVDSSYAARLNADGSLDTNCVVGTSINGPVYAVAIGGASTLGISNNATGSELEDVQQYSLGAGVSGSITVNYDFLIQPDQMKIFYGGTNDYLIYDSGLVNGTNSFTVSFGPTNGFSTNVITIVMNQGNGQFGTVWFYDAELTSFGDNAIYLGGLFDKIGGVTVGGVARLTEDGKLDTTFAPGLGTYNSLSGFFDPVYALALQNGKLLVGGSFDEMQLADYNGLCRLNLDGTIDTTFNPGSDAQNGTYNPQTGIVDSIYAIKLQPDGKILIGGDFTTFNQTRRVGIARLFSYGSVDTSFMDTAYNQFAGLINHYHNPDAVNVSDYPQGNRRNYVNAIGVEPNSPNNVIIGGNFLRVGGGSVFHSGINMATNSGVFANGRMDSHPRSNVARLIGGATTGPGNISLSYSGYSADKSAGTLYVSLVRTNGNLGIISATVAPKFAATGPGIATTNDVNGGANTKPTWPTLYSKDPNSSWPTAPATTGPNFLFNPTYGGGIPNPNVYFNIIYNTNISGNLNASIALDTPDGSAFKLGGEVIPLGTALGFQNLASLLVIDTNIKPGTFGFSSPTYTVNQGNTATITVTRTGGSDSTVLISYAVTNGTASSPTDFTATTNTLTFNPGITSRTFTVPTTSGTTTNADRTVNLSLFGASAGAAISQTNAVLTIINGAFNNGHISFTSATFATNENSGAAIITVNRLGGNSGTLDVTAIVGPGGSAVPGINYIRSTNSLHWNNNDVSVKTIVVPVFQDFVFTTNLTVSLTLTNGKANNVLTNKVLGLSAFTNATLVIQNVDFPGTIQFNASSFGVKKSAGRALIPVVRTGGSAGTVTISNLTVNGTAVAGVNYSNTVGKLTFGPGEVAKYISVPIIDDGQPTGPLDFTLSLAGPSPSTALGSLSNAVVNIIDTASVDEPPGTVDNTLNPFTGCNGNVYALALQPNNKLIVAGDFSMANEVPRRRIARLNTDGSLDSGFLSPSTSFGADSQIRAVVVQQDGRIVAGGFFTNFNNQAQNRLTRLNYDGTLDSTFNIGSGANNAVFAAAQSTVDNKILVGGAFTTLNGSTFSGVGRLNTDGTPDASFNPGGLGATSVGSSFTVYALAVQPDGKVIIGGDFTAFNGVTVNRIARLNTDGTLDTAFKAAVGTGANDSVRAIKIQLDGKFLLGGLFTSFNGTAFNRIVRLNPDGSLDNTFNPDAGANDAVSAIAVQSDGRIVLGGQFTRCNGVTRNFITRLNPGGSVDPTINFGSGASDYVSALAIQQGTIQGYPTNVPDEKIILGGAFTHYNGQPAPHLTRIFGGSVSGSGAFEFSAAEYVVNEDGVNAAITIIRTGGTSGTNVDGSGNIYAQFSTSDDTAVAPVNYSTVITNIAFPMGEVQQTVLVPVAHDGAVTPDLTVNLSVDPVAPAVYGNQPTAVLTIINVDSAISLSEPAYQVAKNIINGVATIDVIRSGSAYGTSTVHFMTTTNGTAVDGVDYSSVPDTLVTFNPGVTNMPVNIPILNNPLPTGYRTVTMLLSNVTGSVLYSPSNAVLTINDTVNAPGTFSFQTNNIVVSEGGTNAYITVLRTNGSSGVVSVKYNTVAGTAVPGLNYTPVSGTLTFGDSITNNTIVVPLVNNNLVQGPTAFRVNLFNAAGGADIASPPNALVTILDNDAGIVFAAVTNSAPEDSGFASIVVLRLYNTNGPASVNYTTVDGTAFANVNYTPSSGTLTFTNGEAFKSLSVPLINNPLATGDLLFDLKLSSPVNAQLIAPSNTVVVIQDADAGITFTNPSLTVLKSSATATITVVCSNPRVEPVILTTNDIPLRVNYTTVNGTAIAGIDYQSVTGTLVFTNGLATNAFTVPIYNNNVVTGDRNFSVVLSNPTSPGQITPYGTLTVTIAESNTGLKFSQGNYQAYENGVTATINVLRTGYTNSTVSVNYLATNGTAIGGVNYVPTSGTLVLTNGVLSQSFNVALIANPIVQPNLTVQLNLSNPTNSLLIAPYTATLTILETGGSYVIPAGAQLVTNYTTHLADGIIGSNNTMQVMFALRDAAGLDVTNLTAYLLATNGVVSPTPASQNYGDLKVYGHSVSRAFTFTAQGTNGQPVSPTLALYSPTTSSGNFIGTAVFNYAIGTWATTFVNTNVIIIKDNTNASPYPSVINVSGLGSSLVKATVTLTNLTHTAPGDIDALVVSPSQTNTLIMAHAGAQFAVSKITVKLDDAATNSLPQGSVITNGVYKPTGYLPVRNFP